MKKIMSFILLLTLVFSFAACSVSSPAILSTSQVISTPPAPARGFQQDAIAVVNPISVNFSSDDLDASATRQQCV